MGWKGGFMVKTQTALAEDLNSFLSTVLGGSRLPVTPATGGSNQCLCPQQAWCIHMHIPHLIHT